MRGHVAFVVYLGWLGLTLASPAAAQPQTVGELERLLGTDPLAAFDEAAGRFEAARIQGDLDGMMAVLGAATSRLRTPGEVSLLQFHLRPLEEMTGIALSLAQQGGQWYSVGELCTMRALFALHMHNGGCWPAGLRFVRLMEVADEAFQKAGRFDARFHSMVDKFRETKESEQKLLAEREEWRSEKLGSDYRSAVQAMKQAAIEGRDAQAVALMHHVVEALYREPDAERYVEAACCVVNAGGKARRVAGRSESAAPRIITRAAGHERGRAERGWTRRSGPGGEGCIPTCNGGKRFDNGFAIRG